MKNEYSLPFNIIILRAAMPTYVSKIVLSITPTLPCSKGDRFIQVPVYRTYSSKCRGIYLYPPALRRDTYSRAAFITLATFPDSLHIYLKFLPLHMQLTLA